MHKKRLSGPRSAVVEVGDELFAGCCGAHLENLDLALGHLPADGAVEGGEGEVVHPARPEQREALPLPAFPNLTRTIWLEQPS